MWKKKAGFRRTLISADDDIRDTVADVGSGGRITLAHALGEDGMRLWIRVVLLELLGHNQQRKIDLERQDEDRESSLKESMQTLFCNRSRIMFLVKSIEPLMSRSMRILRRFVSIT